MRLPHSCTALLAGIGGTIVGIAMFTTIPFGAFQDWSPELTSLWLIAVVSAVLFLAGDGNSDEERWK
jgi:phosphatidylserine synthase